MIKIQVLILLSAIVHVLEEYRFGWLAWSRKIIKDVTLWHFILINTLFILICIIGIIVNEKNLVFSFSIVGLLLLNALIHIFSSIIARSYTPGLFSAVLLYVPLSTYSCYYALHGKLLSQKELVLTFLIGCLWMIFPFVFQGTRIFLKRKNS